MIFFWPGRPFSYVYCSSVVRRLGEAILKKRVDFLFMEKPLTTILHVSHSCCNDSSWDFHQKFNSYCTITSVFDRSVPLWLLAIQKAEKKTFLGNRSQSVEKIERERLKEVKAIPVDVYFPTSFALLCRRWHGFRKLNKFPFVSQLSLYLLMDLKAFVRSVHALNEIDFPNNWSVTIRSVELGKRIFHEYVCTYVCDWDLECVKFV